MSSLTAVNGTVSNFFFRKWGCGNLWSRVTFISWFKSYRISLYIYKNYLFLFSGKIENDGIVSLSNFRLIISTVSIASSTTTPTNAITTVSINASTNHPTNETTNASSIYRKTTTTTTTTMSVITNLVNIPIGLIETCEIREIIHLQIWCKNARSFK